MIRVAVRSLLAGWARALATSLAVVVGVAVVSGTLMVSDTAERFGAQGDGLDVIRIVLPIAGGVALVVGGFIVNLTMAVTIAHRIRELALLRCVGATIRQVRRGVVLESLGIGAIGAVVGLAAGVGMAAATRRLINTTVFPGDLPGSTIVISARTVLAAFLLGCLVTTLSGLTVARRAGRVTPLAALRDATAGDVDRPGAVRTMVGVAATAAALVAVTVAPRAGAGPLLLPAAAVTLVGVRLAGPRLVPAITATVGRPIAALLRWPGELGARNAARHPYRFTAIASAVLIGVALMSLVTVVTASIRSAMVSDLARYRADLEIEAAGEGVDLPADLVARLRALPELATVVPEQCTPGAVVAGEDLLCAADPAGLDEMFDLELTAGRLSDIGTGGIAVNEVQAGTEAWTLGSPVTVQLPGGTRTFPVAAIYRGFYYLGAPIIAPDEYTRLGGGASVHNLYVGTADGVGPAAARAAINRVATGSDTALLVRSRAEVRAAALDQIDAATWVYRILTGLALLVGLFGIVNLLTVSIVERRRELGLLRAIGMSRHEVRSMVRAEAAIIAIVGVGVGVGLGLLFGWATATVLESGSQPIRFTLPAGSLAVIGAVGLAAAIVAAALPASWAGRAPVLRTE